MFWKIHDFFTRGSFKEDELQLPTGKITIVGQLGELEIFLMNWCAWRHGGMEVEVCALHEFPRSKLQGQWKDATGSCGAACGYLRKLTLSVTGKIVNN